MKITALRRTLFFTLLWLGVTVCAFAQTPKDLPARPSPERLVNDLAELMNPNQRDELERQLTEFARTTSTQITIVTVKDLGGFDPSEYATELGRSWGVGQKGKNNGVVVLVSKEDRKMNISPGYGLEGALTDAMCGRIIRNEMAPEFKTGNFYGGLSKAAQAIIAATKGEYTNETPPGADGGGLGVIPVLIVVGIIVAIVVAAIKGGGKGGGGGNYMSRRGGDFITGAILGSIFSGRGSGGSSGGSWGGGGSSGGGGFGGFGGGSFGGGGASGSW